MKSAAAPRRGAGLSSLAVPAVFALLALALLVSLGVWQLHRLTWKEGLLAQIDQRLNAPATPLPPRAQWQSLSQENDEYRHVSVTGRFEHDSEVYVFRTAGSGLGEAGFLVLTPLRLDDGSRILVNRGFVPERLRDPATRAAGQTSGDVTVAGALRWPEERNLFTPADEPARRVWYTRDPVSMARALNLADPAPFSIDADASVDEGQPLHGGATVVSLRNDHLSYAVTWFGLAATLVGVFGVFAWRRLKPQN
ncbi:SURF1 family protein [Roseiarcaceae bacterium H3SJ34-1]|uniref:SURF1 family protein n=1 Tax=Terripilifer ovatus TaxID=3032367 RepID=UPI003AB96A33|nr:SURF1 family protein [Roseiarcaceae bacterium H3SJ34-1]